jgi:hypothetical protein
MKKIDRQEPKFEKQTLVFSLIIMAIADVLLCVNLCQTRGEGIVDSIVMLANLHLCIFEMGCIFCMLILKYPPKKVRSCLEAFLSLVS